MTLPASSAGADEREAFVLDAMLDRQVRERPDKVFADFGDGRHWTFRETREQARACATGLRDHLGVGVGDPVLCWLPNGPHLLRTWFGTNVAGAVYVPINTAYRGRLLEQVIVGSQARVLVVHHELVERLHGIDLGALRTVVIVGAPPDDVRPPAGLAALPESVLDALPERWTAPEPVRQPWDLQAIMYTSGTTGPSKGVLVCYRHHSTGATVTDARTEDKYLVNTPMFHAGATLTVVSMLAVGGSMVVLPGFSTSTFWDVVAAHQITRCTLMGAMASYLVHAEGPASGQHALQRVCVTPFTRDALAFGGRFGVDVWTAYNSTEMSTPLRTLPGDPKVPGTCGRPRPGVEVRIVDEVDRECPEGEVGELVVRADEPWTMTMGYHGMPEVTVAAWRNGWFHSGDAFRRTPDGDYVFIDRLKDVIRRRGENVSSAEVEAEALAHPGVAQAGAVAVPSEFAEDEILLVVARADGSALEPVELIEHLIERLPYFMVPRYLRVVNRIELTPTGKVRKDVLRNEGLAEGTWDREEAGIVLKRERLTT